MTELESNFAFFVAKSWLLLSAAGAMTAVWLNNSSLPLCNDNQEVDESQEWEKWGKIKFSKDKKSEKKLSLI